jgi:hypothetical protein
VTNVVVIAAAIDVIVMAIAETAVEIVGIVL